MSAQPKWREVGLPAFSTALSSGQTYFVPPELRPGWARALPTMSGAWLHFVGGQPPASTGSLSTQVAQARMDTERFDPTQTGLLKYDRYYYVRMQDGRIFQLGPFKELEYGHHLMERPDWTRAYSSNSGGLKP